MNEKTESIDRKNRQKVETEAQLLLQCKKVNKVMMKITGCV